MSLPPCFACGHPAYQHTRDDDFLINLPLTEFRCKECDCPDYIRPTTDKDDHVSEEIELTRTWVVAGSRQAALDKCELMALDPTYQTTRLVYPDGIQRLRGEKARLGDTIAYGAFLDASTEGLRFMFEWLREAGFDFDETDLR